MVNIFTSLNNFKTTVDGLYVDKEKTVLIDLKTLGDMMDKEFVKNTKFKKLKTEVNNLGKCQILLR